MKKVDCYQEVLDILTNKDIEEVYKESLDVNEKDDLGDYLLNVACNLLQPENVSFFISKGADLNTIGGEQNTPLITTIDNYHINPAAAFEIIETLITSGANLEKRGMFGNTPFLMACTRGCTEIIRLLVSKGCNIHATIEDFGGKDNGLDMAYTMHVDEKCINYLKDLLKIV